MKVNNRKLLFVEDNKEISNLLIDFFKESNECTLAENKKDAIKILSERNDFDCILLDVVLPDGIGLDILNLENLPPVIILSDLGSEDDILNGLENGASDYVVKPIGGASDYKNNPSLLNIIDVRISLRLLKDPENKIKSKGITLNSTTRVCMYDDIKIVLTPSEFNILYFLMTHPNEYYNADEIYTSVWNAPSLNTPTVRKHISTMRRKLVEATGDENIIMTDFGRGYAFINTNN